MRLAGAMAGLALNVAKKADRGRLREAAGLLPPGAVTPDALAIVIVAGGLQRLERVRVARAFPLRYGRLMARGANFGAEKGARLRPRLIDRLDAERRLFAHAAIILVAAHDPLGVGIVGKLARQREELINRLRLPFRHWRRPFPRLAIGERRFA